MISFQTQAENSMPQAESRLSTALSLVGSDRHTTSSLPVQSPPCVCGTAPSSASSGSTLVETGEKCLSLGRNWRCKKRAAAAAQLAVISASNKSVTWAIFSLTPPGLWAQTPLLIPSASPGEPLTWQTQLLPFTEDQDLCTANLPALHCSDPQLSPTPSSVLQYEALLTAPALKATYSDLLELCYEKEKRQHQTWCPGLIRTRPLETPMTQRQLDHPRPPTPFSRPDSFYCSSKTCS